MATAPVTLRTVSSSRQPGDLRPISGKPPCRHRGAPGLAPSGSLRRGTVATAVRLPGERASATLVAMIQTAIVLRDRPGWRPTGACTGTRHLTGSRSPVTRRTSPCSGTSWGLHPEGSGHAARAEGLADGEAAHVRHHPLRRAVLRRRAAARALRARRRAACRLGCPDPEVHPGLHGARAAPTSPTPIRRHGRCRRNSRSSPGSPTTTSSAPELTLGLTGRPGCGRRCRRA